MNINMENKARAVSYFSSVVVLSDTNFSPVFYFSMWQTET